MKFDFNWQSGFWENYDLICWLDSNMSDLGWKVKGQTYLETLNLTYQVRIMTLASTVLKKLIFQNISHSNALGSKFDIDVK